MIARFVLEPGRKGGWWGIVFVLVLLVSAGMVSLPTAAESGEHITAFYSAHRQIVVLQQVVGALALVPFFAFVAALGSWARRNGGRRSRWLIPAAALLAAAELITNLVPLIIALASSPSADLAHMLTRVEDIADSALFASIALFVLAASAIEASSVRIVASLVALTSLARAVGTPFGMTALDTAAPLAFVGFVLLLSVRVLAGIGPADRAEVS